MKQTENETLELNREKDARQAGSSGLKTADYWFDLPEELIAQDPSAQRDGCRLLCMDRETGELEHHIFHEITDMLKPGDTLVLNDTKVIPARLLGVKEGTGAHVEVLLLKRISGDVWETLVRPGKKLRPGAVVVFGEESGGEAGAVDEGSSRCAAGDQSDPFPSSGEKGQESKAAQRKPLLRATILDVIEGGNRLVRFEYEGIFEEVLDRLGEMPLPPYITKKLDDPNKYQTVYAKYDGSAAAPTAGLHFTQELLQEIQDKGVNLAWVTLHVGLGTFRPVKVDDVTQHHMHEEWYNVPQETADLINRTHAAGKRVICVGTTSCRTVESAAEWAEDCSVPGTGGVGAAGMPERTGNGMAPDAQGCGNEGLHGHGAVRAGSDNTSIFIYPGYRFKVMDGLITNFHLPESTLLMLVSAFAGRENVLHAYDVAVKERYRFFSFGDAMFII